MIKTLHPFQNINYFKIKAQQTNLRSVYQPICMLFTNINDYIQEDTVEFTQNKPKINKYLKRRVLKFASCNNVSSRMWDIIEFS